MSPRPNFRGIQAQFHTSRKFLVCSVFLGLISTACATAITTPTPTVSQTPSPTPTEPVAQKLVGKWSAWTGNSGDWTTLVFTPNGKFFRLHIFDEAQSVADGWNYIYPSAWNGRQVHFVDGADGGYAVAAKSMKQRINSKRWSTEAYLT